jgi:hypothetical protein
MEGKIVGCAGIAQLRMKQKKPYVSCKKCTFHHQLELGLGQNDG